MPKNYSKFKPSYQNFGGGGKKAIVIGWNLKEMDFFNKLKSRTLKTPYGIIKYYWLKDTVFLPRHGIKENIPPHRINHLTNIYALKKLGVKYIFSFNSVGSLKKEIKPGELLIVSDYIDLNPPTFYEKNPEFITPKISKKLRAILIQILKNLRLKFWANGVYFNTKGPRFETKAEINMIKNFSDVVGMTMAKEATLSNELGLEYASLCSVDNYAHGLDKKPITQEETEKYQKRNKKIIEEIIREILKVKT